MAEITSSIENAGPACKKLTITVPAEIISTQLDMAFVNLQSYANVPGFRKGRAPRRIIEQRFGAGMRDDVRQRLISEGYQKAIEEHKLDPISYPEPVGEMPEELPEGEDLVYTLQLEVTPDVTLPAFDSLKVEEVEAKANEEDIDKEIENLCIRQGKPTQPEDSPVAYKDFIEGGVVITEKGAADDAEPLADIENTHVMVNGESADYKGHVNGIAIANLGKALEGKNIGDTVTVEATGPKMHENEALREKELSVSITITKIHRIENATPAEVATALGMESEEALRERITEGLTNKAEQDAKAAQQKQIADQLIDAVELELPEKITNGQVERLIARKRYDLVYQGKTQEEIEEQLDELRNESEEEAKRQMKSFFILDKASKDLEVEVDDQEINGVIFQMAQQQRRRPDKLAKELQKNGGIEQVYLQIRERKTLDAILAKITGKEEAKEKAAAEA